MILLSSPFVATLFKGASPRFRFEVNGRVYSNVYFLVDGIYPELSVFVKTFTEPQGEMRAYFAMRQEAKRKDIERAFGVLQGRFAIVANPGRFGDRETLCAIWRCCVILHNMIIVDDALDAEDEFPIPVVRRGYPQHVRFSSLVHAFSSVHNASVHHQLRNDLMSHLWNLRRQA